MRRFISLIVISIILTGAWSYAETFYSNGKPHSKVSGVSAVPKNIIDTVVLVDGIGILSLNDSFTKSKHNVAATSSGTIYALITQILPDTSASVNYYGYFRESSSKIIIKSSNTSDNSTVVVNILVK